MLKFLFDSNTSQERQDTKELFARLEEAEREAGLTEAALEADLLALIAKLAKEFDFLEEDGQFKDSVVQLLTRLIQESGLFSPSQLSTDIFIDDVVLDAKNRASMLRKISLNQHAERNRQSARSLIANACTALLNRVPEGIIQGSKPESLVFEISLIDVMAEPENLVEELIAEFNANAISSSALFFNLREQLSRNLDYIEKNIRKNVRPKDLKKDFSSRELVELYLKDTSFESILSLRIPFVLPQKARFEHMHIVAGTGHGKTQTLQYIISKDLDQVLAGQMGFAVIDSQGDLIKEVLKRKAINQLDERVVLIDPHDVENLPALNLFDIGLASQAGKDPVKKAKIFNATVNLYTYIFTALLGAELSQKQSVIFAYLAKMMMVIPDANIHTLRQLAESGSEHRFKDYYDKLDANTRHFFETEFFSRNFSATRKQVMNRLWGVLSNDTFEGMFSAKKNKIDMFEAMNEGKIVLINTAKDFLEPERCSTFGRFFIALIAQAALSRSLLSKKKRTPFFVFIDEAHDYFDEKIEDIANQARKYNVGLTLSHQNLDQANAKLRANITSSTSIKLAGGVSAKDAQAMAHDMRAKSEFILSATKTKKSAQFACFVKNLTPSPVLIEIPFGSLEALPKASKKERRAFLERNRQRVSQRNETAELDLVTPADEHNTAKPSSQKSDSSNQLDQPLSGRGGKRHRQLQNELKKMGEGAGFHVTIERPIKSKANKLLGHVDVYLERQELKIAIEVSVSTDPAHELGNIQKCVQAGCFDYIICISEDARKLESLERLIKDQENFSSDTVMLSTFEKVSSLLLKLGKPEGGVHGYEVNTAWPEGRGFTAAQREMIYRLVLNL
ncbi:MAG: ATP-binding protein [Gammaproteobacteria bacterium]|nr:ATP-binding protein [Gammaproteobacteria bacterium]